ncbi:hypothetical protein MLD38_022349 [Melastoma candidum]|uniref:Uncharacterized protein n=1 Tax=Melastoma candidum TaxID=119954 RepID=A0ACB9QIZ3_9MYRT|nr:hypothetical protein MLD38_022349 [Melastoma candidum]
MDPSIMKLLEEDDEDETMHSGADVEAFQAALNRDIGGDAGPSQGDAGYLSGQSYPPGWQSTGQVENADPQVRQEGNNPGQILSHESIPGQILSHESLPGQKLGDGPEGASYQPPQQISGAQEMSSVPNETARTVADSESQYLKLQKMSNQQASAPEQAGNRVNRAKQVPFALLLPVILPQLDKDRAMQLQTLYAKLKNNDIPKDGFIRIMRGIVGDQMLKMAVSKIHPQSPSNQMHMQASGSIRPSQPRMQPSTSTKLGDSQLPSHTTMSSSQVRPDIGRNAPNSQMHIPVPPYQSGNTYRPFAGTKVPSPGSSVNPQPQDFPTKQFQHHPSAGSSLMGMTTQAMTTMPKVEPQSSIHDNRRIQSGSAPPYAANAPSQPNSMPWRPPTSKEQVPGSFSTLGYVKHESSDHPGSHQQKPPITNFHGLPSAPAGPLERVPVAPVSKDNSVEQQPLGTGFSTHTSSGNLRPEGHSTSGQTANSQLTPSLPVTNAKTPTKKPAGGHKKPLEALGSSPPSASKKQKLSGGSADQSIEQLIDVTAVSGVNLREEEEQLFSGSKEDSRVSEASRKVVQEEEEALILQRGPLQKKMAEIMAKCGLKNVSDDVEKCLSLCVEERLRGLLFNLIRVSKQRVDIEKTRHRTVITSDIRQQLMMINRKAREEWDRKQAEAEKLQKLDEPEGNPSAEGEKDKDESRGKSMKNPPANKEEDDKMRTTAANVAARAAVGGDDMLSKWQLMAEQARQKREGNLDPLAGSQGGKDIKKSTNTLEKRGKDNQEGKKRGQISGGPRKIARNTVVSPQPKVVRTISVKDAIAVLEREPQMSKSSLVYRLYERVRSDPQDGVIP